MHSGTDGFGTWRCLAIVIDVVMAEIIKCCLFYHVFVYVVMSIIVYVVISIVVYVVISIVVNVFKPLDMDYINL